VKSVQIFESFAAAIPKAFLQDSSLRPIRRIVEGVRARLPNAKMIVFAKGGLRSRNALRMPVARDYIAKFITVPVEKPLADTVEEGQRLSRRQRSPDPDEQMLTTGKEELITTDPDPTRTLQATWAGT
jgi:hypothetical protein